MQIRPARADDLEALREIDGTVESSQYLHLDNAPPAPAEGADLPESPAEPAAGLTAIWRLEQRPARQKLIEPNRIGDDAWFTIKQVVTGAEDGIALMVELDDAPVALIVAVPDHDAGTLRVVDLRVDYDYRRQGMGTALVYQVIQEAREKELRAIAAQTLTNNVPAGALLAKCGFELSGVDTRRRSNHDLVKEEVTLFWYVPLD